MKHALIVHSSLMSWECVLHAETGLLSKIDVQPFMKREDLYYLCTRRAEYLCSLRQK